MPFSRPFWSPSEASAILFDWDGVIAETRLDFSEVHKKYYGDRQAMLLEDSVSLPPDRREALMRDLEELEMLGASVAALVPGISGVLEWVRARGIPWAVVSRNCRGSIMLAARVIEVEMPKIVLSRDDGKYVKPDPRALKETCAHLGVSPSETLLLGDYVYDMMGARRAGMRGVLVRKTIPPDWAPWLECSYTSMDDLCRELTNPSEMTPWEYQLAEREYGRDFLRFVNSTTAHLPLEARPNMGEWLVRAASLGIGTFAVPEGTLSPDLWRANQSFDLSCMGMDLTNAVQNFLDGRYPFAKALTQNDAMSACCLPEDASEIQGYLLASMSAERRGG